MNSTVLPAAHRIPALSEVHPAHRDEWAPPDTLDGALEAIGDFLRENAPVPEIWCPSCSYHMLETGFLCPACMYYMEPHTRLEYDVFWDDTRNRWYQAHLTPSESFFWSACLESWYPWISDVRAQASIGAYRTDFLLTRARIIIEIDGFGNHSREADITRDRQRQRWLQAQSYQVIRFSNAEVRQDAELCVRQADYLITLWTGGSRD